MSNEDLDILINEIIRNTSITNQKTKVYIRQVIIRHLVLFCFCLSLIVLYAFSIATDTVIIKAENLNMIEDSSIIELSNVAIPDFEQNISSLNILEILNLIIKNEKKLDDFLSKKNSISNNDIAFEKFYYQLEACKKRLQELTYDEMYEKSQIPVYDETTSDVFKWLATHNVKITYSDNNTYCYVLNSPKTNLVLFYFYNKGYVKINYDYLQKKYSAKLGSKWRTFLKENVNEQYEFDSNNRPF